MSGNDYISSQISYDTYQPDALLSMFRYQAALFHLVRPSYEIESARILTFSLFFSVQKATNVIEFLGF